MDLVPQPFEYKGTLGKHDGKLALLIYTCGDVARYVVVNYWTGEFYLLPLPDQSPYDLKMSTTGYGYIVDRTKKSSWVQPLFNYASYTTPEGQLWVKHTRSDSKMSQSEFINRCDGCIIHFTSGRSTEEGRALVMVVPVLAVLVSFVVVFAIGRVGARVRQAGAGVRLGQQATAQA